MLKPLLIHRRAAVVPVPGSWTPNEPPGMTWWVERGFDAKVEHGWADRGDANFSIAQDPTAPRSPPNVGQAKYPAGMVSGVGPINTWLDLPAGLRTLYVCYAVKISANWVGNDVGVNKMFFIHIGGGQGQGGTPTGRVVVSLRGQPGAAPLSAEIDFQNMGTIDAVTLNPATQKPYVQRAISWNGVPNLGGGAAVVPRALWKKIEIALIANTPGQYDGEAHWWVDGVKVGKYTAIGFSGALETGAFNTWKTVSWNPTYGGLGAPVPADQFMWMDSIYLSGK